MTKGVHIVIAVMASVLGASAAHAQTRGVRDTATSYGARLDVKDAPAALNPNRINNRIVTRLDTRLSLRIERYRPGNTGDPAAVYATARRSDNARAGTDTTLAPLSANDGASSLPNPHRTPSDDGARPR